MERVAEGFQGAFHYSGTYHLDDKGCIGFEISMTCDLNPIGNERSLHFRERSSRDLERMKNALWFRFTNFSTFRLKKQLLKLKKKENDIQKNSSKLSE